MREFESILVTVIVTSYKSWSYIDYAETYKSWMYNTFYELQW